MEKTGVIYGLHLGDHRYRYVGVTTRPKVRLWEHKNPNRNPQVPVSKWIRKHGPNNVLMEILDTFSSITEALFWEPEYISKLKLEGFHLLNLTNGGEGMVGWTPNEETREKMRRNNSGSGNPNYGKKMPEHLKIKFRDAQTGVPRPEAVKQKIIMTKRLVSPLSDSDIRFIRNSNKTLNQLAIDYGIGRNSIWRIKNRLTWKDVD